jgi:hypothetical protein
VRFNRNEQILWGFGRAAGKSCKEIFRHECDSALYFRREWRTQAKLLTLDAVNQKGPRQTVHGASQFHRFTQPERMRRAWRKIFRQPIGVSIPYPDSTGGSAWDSRVHYYDFFRAAPGVHQREAFAGLFDDLNTVGFDTQSSQATRNQQASRVVPAIEIAAADDTNGHGAKSHV